MSQQTSDVTSNDKLMAALCWASLGFLGLISLFVDSLKSRPFIKYHGIHSLVFGVVVGVLSTVLSFVGIGLCIGPLGWVVMLFFAYKAYQGESTTIPVLTDFIKNQGWA